MKSIEMIRYFAQVSPERKDLCLSVRSCLNFSKTEQFVMLNEVNRV